MTLDQVLTVLDPTWKVAAAALLLKLVHSAVVAFEDHTGATVSAADESQIDAWALKAVSFAEEQSLKWFKAEGVKLEGSAKFQHALDYVTTAAKAAGLELDPKRVGQAIEAALPELRSMFGAEIDAAVAKVVPLPKPLPPPTPAPAPGKAA